MSEAVSALNGMSYTGIASVSEAGLQGMITLRGDLGGKAMVAALKSVVGADVPARGSIVTGEKGRVAWMSPDELLVLVDHDQADDVVTSFNKALAGEHALAVNVSDARAMIRLQGSAARDVLAKLAPVDFAEQAFPAGYFRRSRMAQVPAAIWTSDGAVFEVVCFRSVGQYVFDLLKACAAEGSEVGLHAH